MTLDLGRRAIAAGTCASLVLLALSGCFLLPTDTAEPVASDPAPSFSPHDATDPVVGDCWRASYADLADWSSWLGDDPVDCATRHQSYTYFVGTLDEQFEAPWLDGETTAELASAVSAACTPAFEGLGFEQTTTRVNLFFFVADESAWNAGNHDYRCDVAVYAIDSDYNDLAVANLPDDFDELVADYADNPELYDLCLIGDAFGPYESTELFVADCTAQYYWRFADYVDYPSEPTDPLPSTDDLFDFADKACGALDARPGEEPFPYVPTADMWKNDYRYVECWFSTLESPTSIV